MVIVLKEMKQCNQLIWVCFVDAFDHLPCKFLYSFGEFTKRIYLLGHKTMKIIKFEKEKNIKASQKHLIFQCKVHENCSQKIYFTICFSTHRHHGLMHFFFRRIYLLPRLLHPNPRGKKVLWKFVKSPYIF